jgi:hypothetical protein
VTVWATHIHAALVQRLLTMILLAGQVAISIIIMDEFVIYNDSKLQRELQDGCAGFEFASL